MWFKENNVKFQGFFSILTAAIMFKYKTSPISNIVSLAMYTPSYINHCTIAMCQFKLGKLWWCHIYMTRRGGLGVDILICNLQGEICVFIWITFITDFMKIPGGDKWIGKWVCIYFCHQINKKGERDLRLFIWLFFVKFVASKFDFLASVNQI